MESNTLQVCKGAPKAAGSWTGILGAAENRSQPCQEKYTTWWRKATLKCWKTVLGSGLRGQFARKKHRLQKCFFSSHYQDLPAMTRFLKIREFQCWFRSLSQEVWGGTMATWDENTEELCLRILCCWYPWEACSFCREIEEQRIVEGGRGGLGGVEEGKLQVGCIVWEKNK